MYKNELLYRSSGIVLKVYMKSSLLTNFASCLSISALLCLILAKVYADGV